jgi:hypothetical protein
MTFLDRIAPTPLASTKQILLGGWVALLLALLSALLSHVASAEAFDRQIADADAYARDNTPIPPRSLVAHAVAWLNWASVALFIVGVAALTSFAYLNLTFHEGQTMSRSSDEQVKQPTRVPAPQPSRNPDGGSRGETTFDPPATPKKTTK